MDRTTVFGFRRSVNYGEAGQLPRGFGTISWRAAMPHENHIVFAPVPTGFGACFTGLIAP